MRLLELTRGWCVSALLILPSDAVRDGLRLLAIAQRRRREHRAACISSAASKIAIASASDAAIGLSMNVGLPALKHGQRLLQMRPAVVGFQQHAIDALQQLIDRIDDFDVELFDFARCIRARAWCSIRCPGCPWDKPRRPGNRPARPAALALFKSLVNAIDVRRIQADDADLDSGSAARLATS